ncbi:MAG: glycosyltransferase [Candidatus Riflebacteria bacterium]|nr:glycosyltransferase [Candidatus Riflebacteria bacterium]
MTPVYSIIVPAYNEEAFLASTLKSIINAMQEITFSGELIVVDNNSTDATAAIAQAHGAHVVFEPVNQISRARNAGGRVARGDFLVFIDADTTVTSDVLQAALNTLATDKVCGGGAPITFDRYHAPLYRWPPAVWNGLARRFGLAAGSFLFCRRDAFDAIGGFSEKVFAAEELLFVRLLKIWGEACDRNFCVLRLNGVISSARKLEWFSPARFWITLLLLGVFPFAIRYQSLCRFWYDRPSKPV